jgi:uncharacterized protein
VIEPEPALVADQPIRPSKAAASKLRQCAVTRAERSADTMIRFVAGPNGAIAPDLAGKLLGRGVWVTATEAAVTAAVKRNVFAKSLKRSVTPDPGLAALVDRLLLERARQALSFANKAGLVVTGFAKVEDTLERGKAIALVQASDAAEDGVERLWRKFQAISAASGRSPHRSRLMPSGDLSLAMGRLNVVHAALTQGGQARAFLRESLRLEHFRLNDETGTGSALDVMSEAASGLSTGQV